MVGAGWTIDATGAGLGRTIRADMRTGRLAVTATEALQACPRKQSEVFSE